MKLNMPKLAGLTMPKPYHLRKLSAHRMLTAKLTKFMGSGSFKSLSSSKGWGKKG